MVFDTETPLLLLFPMILETANPLWHLFPVVLMLFFEKKLIFLNNFCQKIGPPGKEVGARPIGLHTEFPDGSPHGPSSFFFPMVSELVNPLLPIISGF